MSQNPEVQLTCEHGWHITSINLASYGTPIGSCGATFTLGTCNADVLTIVGQACLGKEGCSITISTETLGDPCPGVLKSLAVQALCSN